MPEEISHGGSLKAGRIMGEKRVCRKRKITIEEGVGLAYFELLSKGLDLLCVKGHHFLYITELYSIGL